MHFTATLILSSTLTVLGLCLFEVVNSLDNAVVNSWAADRATGRGGAA